MIAEPPEVAAMFEAGPPLTPLNDADALTHALNRLATAVEHLTLTILDQKAPAAVQQAPAALQALPAVQTVQTTPACPKHGLDRVKPSSKFAGFYCTAKDETGPRGYCGWQARS